MNISPIATLHGIQTHLNVGMSCTDRVNSRLLARESCSCSQATKLPAYEAAMNHYRDCIRILLQSTGDGYECQASLAQSHMHVCVRDANLSSSSSSYDYVGRMHAPCPCCVPFRCQ